MTAIGRGRQRGLKLRPPQFRGDLDCLPRVRPWNSQLSRCCGDAGLLASSPPGAFRISGELRQFHTVDLRFGEPDPFSNVGGSLLDREVGAMQVLRYFNQPRAGVIAIDINCVNIVTT